jgi:hypothetical protein
VYGLVGEVDRADERGIDFPSPQRPGGQLQRRDPGGFLGAHGEAWSGQTQLSADAVGRDVRHGAQNAGGGKRWTEPVACPCSEPRVSALRQPGVEASADVDPGGLGIAAHPNQDSRAFRRKFDS